MLEFLSKVKTEILSRPAQNIVDMVLFAFLLYALFAFLKKNKLTKLVKYVILFLILSTVLTSSLLDFKLLGTLFQYSFIILIIALTILFPQEMRRGLYKASSPKEDQKTFNTTYDCSDEELKRAIESIVRAVQNMAKKDVGALIVIAPENPPQSILESGTRLNARLSSQLLECLFNTKAPLHDGAVVIRGNTVLAAGCFLPLSHNQNIDKELGTRHRAGVGVTENFKVLTIIVSEETGVISVAYNGELTRYYDSMLLTDTLQQIYGLRAIETKVKRSKKRA